MWLTCSERERQNQNVSFGDRIYLPVQKWKLMDIFITQWLLKDVRAKFCFSPWANLYIFFLRQTFLKTKLVWPILKGPYRDFKWILEGIKIPCIPGPLYWPWLVCNISRNVGLCTKLEDYWMVTLFRAATFRCFPKVLRVKENTYSRNVYFMLRWWTQGLYRHMWNHIP